jgi:hypothetical protein
MLNYFDLHVSNFACYYITLTKKRMKNNSLNYYFSVQSETVLMKIQ